MDTYNMLKKEIRRYIYDQNWQKFTKIQEHSIKLYSESEDNLILIAPNCLRKNRSSFFYLQLIVLKIGKKVLR